MVEFGEWLCAEVLKSVPHRQWVFAIPKLLRIYFMYDRKLLSKLSRCAWKVLSIYLQQTVSDKKATPGATIAVQTFGDFQNFNPHLHIIATDGCFSGRGTFQVGKTSHPQDLEDLFRYEVFKMLKIEGKILVTYGARNKIEPPPCHTCGIIHFPKSNNRKIHHFLTGPTTA